MMPLIVIREQRPNDEPYINEVVRKAYLSNVTSTWTAAVFKEITFQMMVMTAAIMFIFIGIPFMYCILCIPIVLFCVYFSIYSNYLMKGVELSYKKPIQCWVAEACEPLLFLQKPEDTSYRIVTEDTLRREGFDLGSCQRKIIGTVSVCNCFSSENTTWLYRLAVDKSYRRKGVGNMLVKTVQNWSVRNGFANIETAVSECQDSARSVCATRGFKMKQMYHKKIFGALVSYLMYNLEFNLKSPQLQS